MMDSGRLSPALVLMACTAVIVVSLAGCAVAPLAQLAYQAATGPALSCAPGSGISSCGQALLPATRPDLPGK